MDILSLAIGFVVGTLTGASGSYFADKYTDKRRLKEEEQLKDKEWSALYSRFPEIIDEMYQDINTPGLDHVRVFFILPNRKVTLNTSEPSLFYCLDEHINLRAAISYLEDQGYTEDITSGNTPRYRFLEHFIDKLKNSK